MKKLLSILFSSMMMLSLSPAIANTTILSTNKAVTTQNTDNFTMVSKELDNGVVIVFIDMPSARIFNTKHPETSVGAWTLAFPASTPVDFGDGVMNTYGMSGVSQSDCGKNTVTVVQGQMLDKAGNPLGPIISTDPVSADSNAFTRAINDFVCNTK